MPKRRPKIYSLDNPVDSQKSAFKQQLLLIFLPLLIVVAYCAGYIQYRVDHQPNLGRNTHQNLQANQGAQPIKTTDLKPQDSVSTVKLPAATNDSGQASDIDGSKSQAGDSSAQVLQNSSSKTSGKSHQLHVSHGSGQDSDWHFDFRY